MSKKEKIDTSIRRQPQVVCARLVEDIRNADVRRWLLEKIQPKGKDKISNGCMYLRDANLERDKDMYAVNCCQELLQGMEAWESEHRKLFLNNSNEYNKQREAKRQQLQREFSSKIKQFMQSNEDDVNNLFSIVNGDHSSQQEHKDRLLKIKKGMYDDKILGGVYNALMPDGNTYFHSLIASDLTHYALELFEYINSTVNSSNNKHKNNIEDLIPFTKFDSGKLGPKKNFLMLAIAKKYDNEDFEMEFEPKMTHEDYDKQLQQSANFWKDMKRSRRGREWVKRHSVDSLVNDDRVILDKELQMRKYDRDIVRQNIRHKKDYQKHDAQLIKWLIDKAPLDCIFQKDQDGYNLVDYALMKMDKDVLTWLLAKNQQIFQQLLKDSKLFQKLSSNNFDYNQAKDMVKDRYNNPSGLASEIPWNRKKIEVVNFLNNYIKKNCAGSGLLPMENQQNQIVEDAVFIEQQKGHAIDFISNDNNQNTTRLISEKKVNNKKTTCGVNISGGEKTFYVQS